jgi:hypothetical protein
VSKLKVGDLVYIPRRKNKGLGIVLKYVEDVTKEIDVFKDEFWTTHEKMIKEGCRSADLLDLRKNARTHLLAASPQRDLLEAYFQYNNSWCRKNKKSFIYIKWFKQPSYYENEKTREEEQWHPADWAKAM